MTPEDAIHLPALVANLRRTVEVLAERVPGLRFLVLFGSAARLELGPDSDVDLMVLVEPSAGASPLDWLNVITRAVVDVWYEADDGYWWPTTYTEDATASHSDPGFLENVGRDGVLLYARPGAHLPDFLTHCQPFEEWARRAARLADALRTKAEPIAQ
jgi:Polymerase beta, Nucleotidyltransferase